MKDPCTQLRSQCGPTRSRRALLRRGAALAAGAGAGTLSLACGTQRGAGGGQQAAASAVAGKVAWFVRTDPNENRWQNDVALPAMRQKYPNLTIETSAVPTSEYLDRFTAMLTAGSPPEVYTAFGAGFPDYYFNDAPADLTGYLSRDKIDLGAFLPNVRDIIENVYKRNGKYHALPALTTHGCYLFYNADLLAKAGLQPPPVDWEDRTWTWDKFLDYAKKLTKDAGTAEAVYSTSAYFAIPEFTTWLAGGNAFVPEHYKQGYAAASNLGDPAVADGVQLAQDLLWKHHVAPTPDEQRALSGLGNLFVAGRLAMTFTLGSSFWNFPNTVKSFKWGVAAVPRYKDNKIGAYVDPWMVAAGAKNKDGGWALLKYMTSEEGQKGWSQTIGTPPVNRAAHQEWLKRLEPTVSAADLAKATEGADRHSQLVGSHTFIRWAQLAATWAEEVTAVNANQIAPKDFVARAKPKADAFIADVARQAQAKYGKK